MIDRGRARLKLTAGFVSLLDQGLLVEDIVESVRAAVAHRRSVANGERNPRRREELLLFYADAESVLKECIRRLEIAGRSAKMISGA